MTQVLSFERTMPAWLDGERMILGSLMNDHLAHASVFAVLKADDFSTERNRRIFTVMGEMEAAGKQIDRITLAQALDKHRWLESVEGLTYLVSLDDGLPQTYNIENYVNGVKEKSILRHIIVASQVTMDRCFDPADDSVAIIASAERTLTDLGHADQSKQAELLNPGEVIEAAGGLERFITPKQTVGPLSPWVRLNDLTGGYRRGELFVIAGNPAHGKSAALLQIACGVAETGLGAMIFSLESSRASVVQRMACCRARVDSARLRAGYLNLEERARLRKAIGDFSSWPLWIAEHGISTVSGIRAALRRKRGSADVFMVGIDYLQLLQGIGRAANRHAEISEMTRSLKLLAVDENVNIQLLSQLTRDNYREKRAPILSDLRESGSIEADADAVAFIWREEMLKRDREDLRGLAELILAKQREGPIGKIPLVWLAHITKLESRAEDL